jgi:hypothetical protein
VKNTQENITNLADNQIFVFGSNLAGKHNGGGARMALEKFGAIYGEGVGIQGKSYAIPTLDKDFNKIPIDEIRFYIDMFFQFACNRPQYEFLVTKIGCGIAGYTISQIAPLFLNPFKNIILTKEFTDFNLSLALH